MSQCPNFNCYFIVFEHFGLCSCTKLVLRDAAFEMQLTFHVYGSRIRRSPFVCTKPITIFIEPSYSYYYKQSLRSSSDGVHWHVSRFYVPLKHNWLKWRSYIYNELDLRKITRLITRSKKPVRQYTITRLNFSYTKGFGIQPVVWFWLITTSN